MYRQYLLTSASALVLPLVFASDMAAAQTSDRQLPPVTVQAPDQTRRVAAPAAGKKSGARRASAKPAPAESPRQSRSLQTHSEHIIPHLICRVSNFHRGPP